MEQSILKSTKKILGIEPDDESFDLDLITHINTAFSTLNDLGVGPSDGFVIEDESMEWNTYLDDKIKLSKVKTYIYLRTRLLFDPPVQSSLLDAIKGQLTEVEWRLSANREETDWMDPLPPVTDDEESPVGGFGL